MASVGCDEDELPTTRTVPAVSDSSDSEESYVSESPDCYVAPRAATFLRNAKTSSLQDTPGLPSYATRFMRTKAPQQLHVNKGGPTGDVSR